VTYRNDRLTASLKGRWVDDFAWAAGAFIGPVDSYTTFSLAGSYEVNDVSNLLDDDHYQSFGGDTLERRALGYVTLNW